MFSLSQLATHAAWHANVSSGCKEDVCLVPTADVQREIGKGWRLRPGLKLCLLPEGVTASGTDLDAPFRLYR